VVQLERNLRGNGRNSKQSRIERAKIFYLKLGLTMPGTTGARLLHLLVEIS
jgi:hypothetical protein